MATGRSGNQQEANVSAWADDDISKSLPDIRRKGEGQHAEFKQELPPQLHKLAEEVAAFATSGGGSILVGVADDGSVVGLDPTQHDELFHRLQGIVQQVQPRVDVAVYLCHDEGCIAVIQVAEQQPEPVYYYDQRPYVRKGRTTRRALPDEVKERVWAHGSADHRRELERLDLESKQRAADLAHRRALKLQEGLEQIAEDGRMHRATMSRRLGIQ